MKVRTVEWSYDFIIIIFFAIKAFASHLRPLACHTVGCREILELSPSN